MMLNADLFGNKERKKLRRKNADFNKTNEQLPAVVTCTKV